MQTCSAKCQKQTASQTAGSRIARRYSHDDTPDVPSGRICCACPMAMLGDGYPQAVRRAGGEGVVDAWIAEQNLANIGRAAR